MSYQLAYLEIQFKLEQENSTAAKAIPSKQMYWQY